MSDVPSELLSIIFIRVPAEHLIRLRCVCKAWCRLIDDPYFTETHTAELINKNTTNVHLLHLKYYNQPLLLSLNPFNHNVSSIQFNPQRIPSNLWSYASNYFACNGLVLIQRFIGPSSWSILNPLTQDFYDLPWLKEESGNHGTTTVVKSKKVAIGFGYDYATNDYKIVIRNREFGTTFVYRLKSNSWKKINDFLDIVVGSRGVFCNGALHWIGKLQTTIVAFDLGSEKIRVYSIPKKPELHVWPPVLGELGGRLSLTRYMYNYKSNISISQIWLMDKYGDDNSWSLLYEISTDLQEARLRPISLSASKEYLLLLKKSIGFLFVNLKDNTFKAVDFPTSRPEVEHSELCMFQPSLARITSEQITTCSIKLEEQITTIEKLKEPKLKKCNIKLEEPITTRVKLEEPKLKKCNIKLEEQITTRIKLEEPKLKKRIKLEEPKLKKRRKLILI